MKRVVASVLSLPLSLGSTRATTIDVPGDYALIQDAIIATSDGDTVLVAPGTYFESEISLLGRGIVMMGTDPDDQAVVQSTVIDAQTMGIVLRADQGEGAATRIEGLTLTRGRGTGGGVYCEGTSPTIDRCLILRNSSTGQTWNYCGGIYCVGGAPSVLRSYLVENSADWGGAIRISDGSTAKVSDCAFIGNSVRFDGAGIDVFEAEPSIEGCVFLDNSSGYGGAIYWAKSPNGTIRNSVFAGNSANWGGAIYISVSNPTIQNCLFRGNNANWGGAVHVFSGSPEINYCTMNENSARDAGGAIYAWGTGSNVAVTGSILWNDTPREIRVRLGNHVSCTYSDIQRGRSGEGNIDADPLFTEYLEWTQVLAPGSPCIDAGPLGEQDGIPWPGYYPNGPAADMGAYGGEGAAAWLLAR
ncbi:MAG: hypothetical protein CME06_03085 [Gemmatimonadetes bacterium]|nr:hypothetical protein [Gemmatimonadota bacterium]